MQNKDIKTFAYVMRRTNYGEADRILNIITPLGKMSVIAKGVRKEKSKLAGGIEMFSLVELTIHQGKSEFGVVTSAKMKKYFNNIITDLNKMEFAAVALKKINKMAEQSDNPEHFKIVDQVLNALNANIDLELIEAWFLFNACKANGEEANLYFDISGKKLLPDKTYEWDSLELALVERVSGSITANEIKLMRLMSTSEIALVAGVKNTKELLPKILRIARSLL
ncbi:DNA repair protein RecO [Candidatus Saccharibacteria bacterium]|nr:DNA repair protein RecO [Candidatus Saccharibacteria bacterium]